LPIQDTRKRKLSHDFKELRLVRTGRISAARSGFAPGGAYAVRGHTAQLR